MSKKTLSYDYLATPDTKSNIERFRLPERSIVSETLAVLDQATIANLLAYAYNLAPNSPDPSTKNAALIVNRDGQIVTQAVNQLPKGIVVTERIHDRSYKYPRITHAEEGAVLNLARLGIRGEGLFMVCPWACCSECAKDIINGGIAALYNHQVIMDQNPEAWAEKTRIGLEMLSDTKIPVFSYTGILGMQMLLRDSIKNV